MTSPSSPIHAQAAQRPPVLKIATEETFSYGFVSHQRNASSSSTTNKSTSPTTHTSYQGGRCHHCGGLFVISNRCSNRDCDHVQCSQCF